MRSLFLDQSRETQHWHGIHQYFPLLTTPDTRHPTPDTRHPTPDTRLPTPYSLLPTPYSRPLDQPQSSRDNFLVII
ncbi:hypothetical protein [Moorena sp. SIO2C4]|uniref:hypothetical protein n=1 Tax=Moorena sp. SIO2C4 TaxID=2607824 RepID=UPI0013BEF252|nr:hypothetical protein [Moorena sp. SIO2C4]NEQ15586.1 hypothetical protein [Moorena sp. SIO3E2]NES39937.1 hypothetical protein [Moorena sp. SIO2C4]